VQRLVLRVERWIQRQAQIRARAFEVRRNRKCAAQYHLLIQEAGRVRETNPRLEIFLERLIQSAAGAGPGPEHHLTRKPAEVRLPVGDLDPRRMVLPADAEVQRQVVRRAPVVLNVDPINRGAMSPGARADSAAEIGWEAEDKVGFADQQTLRYRVHGVR